MFLGGFGLAVCLTALFDHLEYMVRLHTHGIRP